MLTVIMICLGKSDGASNEENDYQKLLHLLSVLADEKMAVDEKLHIMRAFQVSAERACEVLQISFENYLSAKAAMSNIR